MLVLEGAGRKFDSDIVLANVDPSPTALPLELEEKTLALDGVERTFKIFVRQADPQGKAIRLKLQVRTWKPPECIGAQEGGQYSDVEVEFGLSFFDFPMIDNTRLSCDQRCAIVLNGFDDSAARITVIYFPGSYASLKDKPYYEDVLKKLAPPGGPVAAQPIS
jgi:hypothetical protein